MVRCTSLAFMAPWLSGFPDILAVHVWFSMVSDQFPHRLVITNTCLKILEKIYVEVCSFIHYFCLWKIPFQSNILIFPDLIWSNTVYDSTPFSDQILHSIRMEITVSINDLRLEYCTGEEKLWLYFSTLCLFTGACSYFHRSHHSKVAKIT